MTDKQEFNEMYQELRGFFTDSGDLVSALLPFVSQTDDFQLAATMLHTQMQTIDNLSS